MIFRYWLAGALLCFNQVAWGKNTEDFSYQTIKQDQHVLHVITINPKKYRFELIKAHNQVFGRETVEEIARRKGALAAINAGFFEIGGNADGRPSLSLVINGKIIGLAQKLQNFLVINSDNLQIIRAKPQISLTIDNKIVAVSAINQISKNQQALIYNDFWGTSTITSANYYELLISDDEVKQVFAASDNIIPRTGLIVSLLKKNAKLPKIGAAAKLKLTMNDTLDHNFALPSNLVSGIPQLVKNGQVDNLENSNKAPAARTAIGIRGDGTIVIVVAEHVVKDLKKLSFEQLSNILTKQKHLKLEDINLATAKKIVEQNLQTAEDVIGLNLIELAEFLIKRGCLEAINLDGGGSSTMFLNGKIVNRVMGDVDEDLGNNVLRPVSDAILIFRK